MAISRAICVAREWAMPRVVTMHRYVVILGPAIHVLYCDLSIAIRIAILIAIRIAYCDQCIAIRDTYHDATSGTSRYANAA